MKAYKYEVIVIDFENYGSECYKCEIEQSEYIRGSVISVQEADIGEWSDDHILNKTNTPYHEKMKFFKIWKSKQH